MRLLAKVLLFVFFFATGSRLRRETLIMRAALVFAPLRETKKLFMQEVD